MSKTPFVVIVGGGPGGLALAQGLKKAGIPVKLYERDRTRADYVHGFRLRIRTRGIEALRHCLPAELFGAFERTCGRAPRETRLIDEQLEPLPRLGASPIDDDVHLEKSVSRITLQQILLAGLDDVIETGRTFECYEEREDGRITIHFTDGGSVVADLLVGADGAESAVRHQLLPHVPWMDTGAQRIAGKIDLTAEARASLAPWLYTKNATVQVRDGLNLFITTHRINHHDEAPADAVFTGNDASASLHAGLLFDNTRDYVFWALGTPSGKLPPADVLRRGRHSLHEWVEHTAAGWHPDLRGLLRLTDPTTVNATPIRTSLPVAPWPTRSVTLLGDAIHAMTYFRALGANAALHDAQLLVEALASGAPLREAVQDYEARMLAAGGPAVLASIESFRHALGDEVPVEAWQPVPFDPVLPPAARPAVHVPVRRAAADGTRPVVRSPSFLSEVEPIARSGATVLVIGETGTGKELVARDLHDKSGRTGPFVAINCAAFTESLIDAELFGHEVGAFTGADQARPGWFEAADGGTLFLDEIGDMPLAFQVKLLRVLQEREVTRIGSRSPRRVDVRLVAATHADLALAVQQGRFRADLFYRLHVAVIRVPPLRDRVRDVVPLARGFVELYRRRLEADAITIGPEAEQALREHDWPGNVRELENVIHYAVIVCPGDVIEREHLRLPRRANAVAGPVEAIEDLSGAVRRLLEHQPDSLFELIEQAVIKTAFEFCDANQMRTARELGLSRNVLRAQLKRFGLLADGAAAG